MKTFRLYLNKAGIGLGYPWMLCIIDGDKVDYKIVKHVELEVPAWTEKIIDPRIPQSWALVCQGELIIENNLAKIVKELPKSE